MAQGTGLPGLPQPGDFATEAEGPDPSTAGAGYAAVAHTLDQANQLFDGADRLAAAHQQMVDGAQLSQIRSGIDGHQAELAAANPFDAQGFSSAASQARSQVISAAPPRYKQAAAQYWDLGAQATQTKLAVQGVAQDHLLAGQGMQSRIGTVGTSIQGELSSGAPLATAWSSPAVSGGMQEIAQLRQTLVNGKYLSPEQAAADAESDAQSFKAAAFTGHVLQTLQSQGSSAAIGEIERLQAGGVPNADRSAKTPDPSSWEAGVSLSSPERALMVAKARAAATSAISLQQEQASLTQAQQAAAATALDKRAADSVAQVELTGKPNAAVTQADFATLPGGQAKYVAYLHSVADAIDKHNTNGDLAQYATPEAAAQHIADVGDLKQLPKVIGSQQDFDSAWEAVKLTEGGVRNGVPLTSKTGAMGVSQIELGTARLAAAKLGKTDASMAALATAPDATLRGALLNPDQSVNERLGRQAWADALASQNGDPTKAYLAYHNGPGAVAGLIHRFGDPTTGEVTLGDFQGKLRAAGYQQTADAIGLFANAQAGGQKAAAYHQLQQTNDWQVNRDANVGDPLQFAAQHGRSDIQPLNLNGFSDPAQAKAWGQALVQRQAQGQNLSQAQGVPARILTNGEASAYRDRIAADPVLGVRLATAASSALGPQGAEQFMREVGQTDGAASVGVQAGLLAASGHAGARFVGSVVSGLQAKQAGAKDGPLPKGVTWEKAQASIAPAFSQMGPGTLAGVMQTAQLAHLGESQNNTPASPDQYLRSAMGGWTNPQTDEAFGGVAPVNGMQTIHPVWMKVGAMPSAMLAIAQAGRLGASPPVYANGQPMRPAAVAQAQPLAMPDGTYVLRDQGSGKAIRTAHGDLFHLDLDANKPFLAARGGIVAQGY